jgi:hypothetical protein
MLETNKSAAVHIAPEHQSAPKEHWADKEVAKAAEEIREGQFRPDLSDDADLLGMVGISRGLGIKDPRETTPEEKQAARQEMADSLALAQHPRVQETLARLEQEKREARSNEEAIEKSQMLHEMNARAALKSAWDGQGRWVGKENEEMRAINLLAPHQWLERLEAVIGEHRVFINRFAVLKRVAVLVPNTERNRSLIILPGEENAPLPTVGDNQEFLPCGTLQWPCGPEWMVMKFDEYGAPTRAKYLGWRTALLCLISKRIITEKEAHQAFPLGDGPAGDWYREQLFELRSRDGVVN